jgi:hypothetical protein
MSVKWLMELVDKVSPPAKGVAKSLEHVDRQVEKLDKHATHAQGTLAKFAHHIEEANKRAGKEFLEGLADKFAVFNVGYELAEKFAEKLFEVGKEFAELTIESANFGRESRIVFGALTGSSEKAEELTEYFERWGDAAGVAHTRTRDLVNTLTRGGFEGKNLNVVMNAAFDVESLTFGKKKAEEFADAFLDISEKGQLTSRGLMSLKGVLGEGGFDKLAGKLKLGTHGFHELQQALEQTPVGAHRAQQAILDVLEDLSGGKLGATREKLGHELPAIIQRFHNHVEELFTTVGQSDAWQKFLDVADRFAEAFDPATASGKRFEAAIEKVTTRAGELLDKFNKQENFDAFVEKMTRFADSAATVAKAILAITEGMAKLINFADKLPTGTLSPLGSLSKAWNWISEAHDKQAAQQGAGFLSEQRALAAPDYVTAPKYRAAGEDAFDGLELGFRKAGDSHSPSQVMVKAGRDAFEGLRLGVQGGPTSGTRTAPQLHVHLEVNVVGGGSNAEELGHLVARVALGELQPAFDTLLEQLGEAA